MDFYYFYHYFYFSSLGGHVHQAAAPAAGASGAAVGDHQSWLRLSIRMFQPWTISRNKVCSQVLSCGDDKGKWCFKVDPANEFLILEGPVAGPIGCMVSGGRCVVTLPSWKLSTVNAIQSYAVAASDSILELIRLSVWIDLQTISVNTISVYRLAAQLHYHKIRAPKPWSILTQTRSLFIP